MNENTFRTQSPARTYSGKVLKNYRAYKDYLCADFNKKCGYTDCSHFWFGGKTNFQIDHFKPVSKFPDLATAYSNLVYSCSHVNRAKSNDLGGYIDPCDTDYNEHFYRDELGNILPRDNSEVAKYMYKRLKLYLKRYGIIWTLERLEYRMEILGNLIERTGDAEAKELFVQVGIKYTKYKKYLRAEQ